MANNPNAQTIQGPGPNIGDGYPVDVNVLSGGGSPTVVVTDIEDGTGVSIMNPALNAARVEVVNAITAVVSGIVAVSNFPAVQPVSGTVTVDQGLPGALPWPVTISGGSGGASVVQQDDFLVEEVEDKEVRRLLEKILLCLERIELQGLEWA